MEIKCPSCRKTNKDSDMEGLSRQCKRCGGDLSKLFTILEIAEYKLSEAKSFLFKKDAHSALINAEESWKLKHSAGAARLAFLSAVAIKNYSRACAWHLRTG